MGRRDAERPHFKRRQSILFPENVNSQADKLFAELARKRHLCGLDAAGFAGEAAHFLGELNAIHPFREGNGRAQLTFLMLLAENAKYPLDANKIHPKRVIDAMIASFDGDEEPLAKMIEGLIQAE